MIRLPSWLRPRRPTPRPHALADWFHVRWDDETVWLDVAPPGREPWRDAFSWNSVMRVCFKAEGGLASDGVHVFTSSRPESYAIPIEADGGSAFWNEVLRRKLFDADLAIEAASSMERLFCWPPADR